MNGCSFPSYHTLLFLVLVLISGFLRADIPDQRIVAEWEPALGSMIRWPLGIPGELVRELAEEDSLYVLVENINQQNQAINSFQNLNVILPHVRFILTDTYSHWTRDYGPHFLIGIGGGFQVINQQFNGYPEESGCAQQQLDCDENMLLYDCLGYPFCNNEPAYPEQGYDCYVNDQYCQDFNNDGQIMDWLGDGYCDDGSWNLDFRCDEYGWDCGDCGDEIIDPNGYCDTRTETIPRRSDPVQGRPLPEVLRGWDEDDDTNPDFAQQMGWEVLDLPYFWTGGNVMMDGYNTAFSTVLMPNENDMDPQAFTTAMAQALNLTDYYILDNPNVSSIQHIDTAAKLLGPEKILVKQLSGSSPEYECFEHLAQTLSALDTQYNRPYEIVRIYCPDITGGGWETNPTAAYTNSLILNRKVLVPQYGIPEDELAIQTYIQEMPGYEIIGFDGAPGSPWYGEDALHCRVMGVFDPLMLHISHQSIRNENVSPNEPVMVNAEIQDYSGAGIDTEQVLLHYRNSVDPDWLEGPMMAVEDGFYTGVLPAMNTGQEIQYYISAVNLNGKVVQHPPAGWHVFWSGDNQIGDINGDSEINVLDIVLAVNMILGNSEIQDHADINSDGDVNILDIVLIINIILS